jgi:hypothetical protein
MHAPHLRCCSAATLAQPTRKSLDGIKSLESSALRPEQLIEDIQTLPVASSTAEVSGIPHSVSAASLSSESDLALLLGVGDASQAGSTPLVFGSFPPVAVSLPSADSAEATVAVSSTEAQPDVLASTVASEDSDTLSAEASNKASKLNAASHEFYPQAYLAAAATALAARTLSSAARAHAGSAAPAAAAQAAAQQTADQSAAAAAAAPEQESQGQETTETAPAADDVPPAVQAVYASTADQQPKQAEPAAHQQQQQYWAVQQYTPETQQQQQQWQQPLTEQQWMEQQQQWQHWQQQHAQHQMMPMSVLVPVYVQPYPYSHYVQQHPQMHMVPVMMPADASAAAAVAAPGYYQAPHQQQQPQQQLQVCPPSPSGYSLPADTCSLMSATTPAATPTGWQHNTPYGSSRPGSSAGSVVSMYSSSTSRRQRQHFGDPAVREAGTVTVSAMSCVKDAAGALAKVVTRHGNGMLLSLVKPGESVAQATHVAAKSLAVARFYVNAHMAAAGAAGIDAAAALTGVEHPAQSAAAADAVDDEVVFMPYHRSSSRQAVDAADVALGFMVAKASAKDLPVLLPPPVGIPACMQDKVQQQGQQQRTAAAATSSSAGSSSGTLLKAGANTDVNKLSNAVIHNILGRWVLLQVALLLLWVCFCLWRVLRSTSHSVASMQQCIDFGHSPTVCGANTQ